MLTLSAAFFSSPYKGLYAMSMSCLCSHLPTHGVTAHPMVTIRISDRQRLIQPYIHNYAWLLFAALALYSAHLASAEDVDGEKLNPEDRGSASLLRSQCMQLVGDCLMKAHQGKGNCSSCIGPGQLSAAWVGRAFAEVEFCAW